MVGAPVIVPGLARVGGEADADTQRRLVLARLLLAVPRSRRGLSRRQAVSVEVGHAHDSEPGRRLAERRGLSRAEAKPWPELAEQHLDERRKQACNLGNALEVVSELTKELPELVHSAMLALGRVAIGKDQHSAMLVRAFTQV